MLADLKIAYQFPEAADASGITKRELRKLVKAGDLDVFLAGNRVSITGDRSTRLLQLVLRSKCFVGRLCQGRQEPQLLRPTTTRDKIRPRYVRVRNGSS